jgi:hypothetical protein
MLDDKKSESENTPQSHQSNLAVEWCPGIYEGSEMRLSTRCRTRRVRFVKRKVPCYLVFSIFVYIYIRYKIYDIWYIIRLIVIIIMIMIMMIIYTYIYIHIVMHRFYHPKEIHGIWWHHSS